MHSEQKARNEWTTPPLPRRVAERVPQAADAYHRLVLVVGPPRTGKTNALRDLAQEHGWPLVNVNLELSEALLELTTKQRAVRVLRVLGELVAGRPGDVLLLDNTEVLFSPDLQQDPLRLLQGLSRNRTLVASWSAALDGGCLTYAQAPHPEYRRYPSPGVIVVPAPEGRPAIDRQQPASPRKQQEKPA